MSRRDTEYTASVSLSQAREIPSWQKPVPVRKNGKGSNKGKRGFSFRALFKSGRVE